MQFYLFKKCQENDPFFGLFTKMLSPRDHGVRKINQLKPLQRPMGFQGHRFFFLSFYRTIPRLILKCTVINLDKLNDSLKQKKLGLINRKGVVFHHVNARSHTSFVIHRKLLQLEWDVLPHPLKTILPLIVFPTKIV